MRISTLSAILLAAAVHAQPTDLKRRDEAMAIDSHKALARDLWTHWKETWGGGGGGGGMLLASKCRGNYGQLTCF